MRIIDENIHNAFLNCRAGFASNRAMARALGLSPSMAGRLLYRQVSHLDDATWARVSPLLLPYFEENHTCTNCRSCPRSGDCEFQDIMEEILSVPRASRPAWFASLKQFVEKNAEKYK